MSKMDIDSMQKILRKHLNERRYQHTLGVMYTCAALAMNEGIDIQQAMIAGLLHDCAKCVSDKKKILLSDKYNIQLTAVERKNPALIHAKLGAHFARTKYGVEDHEILSAIIYHTTGRPRMTTLEKIVYIADSIEPHRSKVIMTDARKTAFSDLDMTLYNILNRTLQFLNRTGREVDTMTNDTFNYYKKVIEGRR